MGRTVRLAQRRPRRPSQAFRSEQRWTGSRGRANLRSNRSASVTGGVPGQARTTLVELDGGGNIMAISKRISPRDSGGGSGWYRTEGAGNRG